MSVNRLITFSGGRTSAFMAGFCKERYKNDNLLFVFANTGKERPETLDFVNQCDKQDLRELQGNLFSEDLDIEFSCFCANV